jgi:crossover junction endodeoxyribonuclease RuvC
MSLFMGIDPGKAGGVAVVTSEGSIHHIEKMPQTESQISQLFNSLQYDGIQLTIIERVHAMPGQGVTSMFTFGQGYGGLRMALHCFEFPFEDVTPQAWMKTLLPRGRNKEESTAVWKNFIIEQAKMLYPRYKTLITKNTADALMIAEYARRKYER